MQTRLAVFGVILSAREEAAAAKAREWCRKFAITQSSLDPRTSPLVAT